MAASKKTNVPLLKGSPKQGSRPGGAKALVPNGQYPTVIGTHGAPGTGAPQVTVPGDVTINSTPAKR